MSLSTSSTALRPTTTLSTGSATPASCTGSPTNTACFGTPVPTCDPMTVYMEADLTDMPGTWCQVTSPDPVPWLAECCAPGAGIFVVNDCTRYCEVTSTADQFFECAQSLPAFNVTFSGMCNFSEDELSSTTSLATATSSTSTSTSLTPPTATPSDDGNAAGRMKVTKSGVLFAMMFAIAGLASL